MAAVNPFLPEATKKKVRFRMKLSAGSYSRDPRRTGPLLSLPSNQAAHTPQIKITRTNGGDILEAQGVPRERLPREYGGYGPSKAQILEDYHETLYKFCSAQNGARRAGGGGGAEESGSQGAIPVDDPSWEGFAEDPSDEAWAVFRARS